MRRSLLFSLLAATALPLGAGAGVINFDEISPANSSRPMLTEEYADMGVHFITVDDGSIWSGLSEGDPGGWGLEGTNGSAFVGMNGRSYELSMLLDEPVENFSLDVARSMGSSGAAGFVLEGYLNGVFVEDMTVDLGPMGVNEWLTASLKGPVDEVRWLGVGANPYGVDNVRWGADGDAGNSHEAMQIAIDVMPGASDVVNPFSRGVVPVVIHGSADFDVADVNLDSVGFGPNGAPIVGRTTPHMADIDGDGYMDLICHPAMPDTGIAMGDEQACLTGETQGATAFEGCAPIHTVPKGRSH
jgi:hypothetical protein